MDLVRCRQFRIRPAIHGSRPHLRELLARSRWGIQYRVNLGLHADHRIPHHRAADADPRLHRRRARHENQVLHRVLRHRRPCLLRDGAPLGLGRIPRGVHACHHRFERLTDLL